MRATEIPAIHSPCELEPAAVAAPEAGTECHPTPPPPRAPARALAPNTQEQHPQTSVWEAENEGQAQGNFSPAAASSALPPGGAGGSLCPGPAHNPRSHHGTLKPASAGWTGRSWAPGRSPPPLPDPRFGVTPPAAHSPGPGRLPKCGQGAPGRGWVIQSPAAGARTPWWPWADGSTPRGRAPTCRISPS